MDATRTSRSFHPVGGPSVVLAMLLASSTAVVMACGDEGGQIATDAVGGDVHASAGCVDGTLGCPCLASGGCNGAGLECDFDGTCQAPSCGRGSPGCGCRTDGSCAAPYTCQAGACQIAGGFDPAKDTAKCYTPCKSGYLNGQGQWVGCPADGLMEGCLSGRDCIRGSCLPRTDQKSDDVNVEADGCSSPIECPDWQTCIQGKCYSICDSDMECPSGLACYRHVCRAKCTAGGTECPVGMFCLSTDGPGYCMHQAPATAQGTPAGIVNTFDVDSIAKTFTQSDGRF